MRITLSVLSALLGIAFWVAIFAPPVQAHENLPTIIDLRIDGSAAEIDIRANLEALISGTAKHDQSGTGNRPEDTVYNALRDLSSEELAVRFSAYEPTYRKGLSLSLNGQSVPLTLVKISAGETGDTSVARESEISYTATLPSVGGTLTWSYDTSYGDTVLRLFLGDATEPRLAEFTAAGVVATVDLDDVRPKTGLETFLGYIAVGFDHIIPKGLDHILFVIGLFLLAARMRPLLWQITMFTLAHTITLALGALGWVNLPGTIVEPLIAASIAYVAIENVFTERLHPWRTALIFCFGLLHGLGFASVLGDFGLPDGQFVPALIGFNIGVELGQITVIAACFALVGYWFRDKPWYHRVIVVPASLAIAAVALYWVVERTGLVA